jgi:3-oxoacyl-[acyl-carrier protein] reductase
MMLENKTAVIHGGGGAIGRSIARAFAREGARVFLAGRTRGPVEAVAAEIRDAGGYAEASQVDALDEAAAAAHADEVVWNTGAIDIALNAVGFAHVQGVPFTELSLQDYMRPIELYTRTHFVTSKAVARHMVARGSGVVFTISTPGAQLPGNGFMGIGVACAAIEGLTRQLAGELGPRGVRVVCLRPDAIPEAASSGSHGPASHTRSVFSGLAAQNGCSVEAMLDARARSATLLRRLPTLDEVANAAAFLASDMAGAMTGTVANLTCGSLVD